MLRECLGQSRKSLPESGRTADRCRTNATWLIRFATFSANRRSANRGIGTDASAESMDAMPTVAGPRDALREYAGRDPEQACNIAVRMLLRFERIRLLCSHPAS